MCLLSDVLVRFSTLFWNESGRKRVVEGFLNTSSHSFHPLAPLSPKFDRLVQKHEHHSLLEGTETEQHEFKSLNNLKLQSLKGQTPKKQQKLIFYSHHLLTLMFPNLYVFFLLRNTTEIKWRPKQHWIPVIFPQKNVP